MADLVFYVDRAEGLLWCARCVPAEVAHIVLRFGEPPPRGKPAQERFAKIDSLSGQLHGKTRIPPARCGINRRCSECGVIQE